MQGPLRHGLPLSMHLCDTELSGARFWLQASLWQAVDNTEAQKDSVTCPWSMERGRNWMQSSGVPSSPNLGSDLQNLTSFCHVRTSPGFMPHFKDVTFIVPTLRNSFDWKILHPWNFRLLFLHAENSKNGWFLCQRGKNSNFLVFSQQSHVWLLNRPLSTLSNASSCDVKSSQEKLHLSYYLFTAKFNYPQLFYWNVFGFPSPAWAGGAGGPVTPEQDTLQHPALVILLCEYLWWLPEGSWNGLVKLQWSGTAGQGEGRNGDI